jgi:hypothetical protein
MSSYCRRTGGLVGEITEFVASFSRDIREAQAASLLRLGGPHEPALAFDANPLL